MLVTWQKLQASGTADSDKVSGMYSPTSSTDILLIYKNIKFPIFAGCIVPNCKFNDFFTQNY
jgi:hypothetical protein